MKGENSPLLRAMYIILVPVVLLIILLNSGYLQRFLPACTVGGQRYNVTQYNFYYFDYYNDFLETHADELDALGYDPQQSASKQSYDGIISWKEFFQREAEAMLSETAYYCDLAEAAGYVFSEEELSGVAERLAENAAAGAQYGINTANYYISYYGAGMNEDRYAQELTRKVKAQAYKAHLEAEYVPDEAALSDYLAAEGGTEYEAVNLRLITLDALPDRATGEVGEAQLRALEEKLARLEYRYESGVSFEELQAAFSTCAVGNAAGEVTAIRSAALPDVLTALLLDDQSALAPAQTFSFVDDSAGRAYFVEIVGFAGSGLRLDGTAALARADADARLEGAMADYAVERNSLGMMIATT